MQTETQHTVVSPALAFEQAVLAKVLSRVRTSPNYVGKFMYMFTNPEGHAFKNITTREYIYCPVPVAPNALDLARIRALLLAQKWEARTYNTETTHAARGAFHGDGGIAVVPDVWGRTRAESDVFLALIVAAPALYSACLAAQAALQKHSPGTAAETMLADAIDKAEGR